MNIKKIENIIDKIYNSIDIKEVMERTFKLIDCEMPQTFSAYNNSANYVYELLKNEGLEAELLTFPADGKTVYQDWRTPLAWEASVGKLSVVKSDLPISKTVIADYKSNPYCLIKHSTSTPKGGVRVPLITEEQVYAGEDCRGCMVLLGAESPVRPMCISPLLDMGALGFVTDNLRGAMDTPDSTQWINAATDDEEHWHVQADDRDFIGFAITPRIGRELRQAAAFGKTEVLVESDAYRYEGKINAVTALLKGKDKRELWICPHLFEPLSNDNSSSAICAIEAAKQIKKLADEGSFGELNFSIRLVFAMECYGYAAVADYFGNDLSKIGIGGINLDCLPVGLTDNHWHVHLSPMEMPFYGNYILEAAFKAYENYFECECMVDDWDTAYDDDMFYNDSTIGLPMVMPEYSKRKCTYWHNSFRDKDNLQEEKMHRAFTLIASWAAAVSMIKEDDIAPLLTDALSFAIERLKKKCIIASKYSDAKERMSFYIDGEKKRILDFKKISDINIIKDAAVSLCVDVKAGTKDSFTGKWSEYAKGITCKRLTKGLPYDLARLPKSKHRILPDAGLYGPISTALSRMDGKTDLLTLLKMGSWEFNRDFTEKDVKTHIDAIMLLTEGGYLETQNENEITKDDIIKALTELGINKDDTLLVHSSQSGCGHIDGGADTIIDSFAELVGSYGTVLMPSFTRPYVAFEGTINRARNFRPYTMENTNNIWTGAVAKAMANRKNTFRSRHISHSWCGFGKKADECLKYHKLLDSPASENSPLAKALELGGKVVFFGCGLGSNTFIHHMEYMSNSIFLDNAIVKYIDENGRMRTSVIEKHVPGHRDFYEPAGIKAKFYIEAIKKGLHINEVGLGLGKIYMMDLKQLYKIGMELFRENPDIVLCDDENCRFCKTYKSK